MVYHSAAYILGYILAGFFSVLILGQGLAVLYRRSPLAPQTQALRRPPSIRAHALISFSVILPFAALTFLLLTFAAMMVAPSLTHEGRAGFVWEALFLPTGCFLLGYFYFKRVAGS